MSTEQETKRIAKEMIKIGFDTSKSILEVLAYFIRENSSSGGLKEYKSFYGKEYKSKEEMILDGKSKGIKDFSKVTITDQNNQIKMLKKYCRERGVDILLEKRPENMDELFKTYLEEGEQALTSKEADYIKAFTIKENDELFLIDSGAIVQFKSQDIGKMEDIVKELEQYSKNISKRKAKAEEKIHEFTSKVKDIRDRFRESAEVVK